MHLCHVKKLVPELSIIKINTTLAKILSSFRFLEATHNCIASAQMLNVHGTILADWGIHPRQWRMLPKTFWQWNNSHLTVLSYQIVVYNIYQNLYKIYLSTYVQLWMQLPLWITKLPSFRITTFNIQWLHTSFTISWNILLLSA